MDPKFCEHCGQRIPSTRSDAKCCSAPCRVAARRVSAGENNCTPGGGLMPPLHWWATAAPAGPSAAATR